MSAAENKAVFLSYASQDAEAAKKICDALRAAGVEVWFDQSELRGGDAWDQNIRRQIKECALFVPVISATTNARAEGYFRLEWKLAVDRSHLMADDAPFLFPIVIGDVTDATARVPDKFREVQWTRLRLDETPAELAGRVAKLLSGVAGVVGPGPASARPATAKSNPSWLRYAWAGVGVVFALVYALRPMWQPARTKEAKPAVESSTPAAAQQTEAQKLVAQARKIYDDGDELDRENLFLADDLVKRALALDPAEPAAWELAAALSYVMVWQSFDTSEARRETLVRQAARARALAPESVAVALVSVNARLALIFNQLGSQDQATRQVEQEVLVLAKREPRNWQVQRALGTVYRLLNRPDEAFRALDRAVEYSDKNPMAVADLANVLLRRHRDAEAEAHVASALARKPTGRLLALDVYLKVRWRGDFTGAQQALGSWPDWLLQENRGVYCAWLTGLYARQPDKAQQATQRLQREYLRDSLFSGPRAALAARAHELAGQPEAAQAAWRTAVQLCDRELTASPGDPSALYWRAWGLARLGDTAAALASSTLLQQQSSLGVPAFLRSTSIAALWVTVGRADLAYPELEKSTQPFNDSYSITRKMLELDPAYDPVRSDPRFQALVAAAPAPAASPAAVTVALTPDSKSVAVLAFANLSDDKDNEYFSDGISEELLNVLAKIPDLKVSARTSAFHFKGTNTAIPEIARQLGVAYVVEGSVRKQGTKVRITAQLIKAADGFHVWSDTFTRELKDIFAVQDEIAGLIAQNLQLKMGFTKTETHRPVDPTVYQEYLIGRALVAAGSTANARDGIARFREVVRLDPTYTAAWVQIARTYVSLSRWGGLLSPDDWAEASHAMERAVALEPNSPEVWLALGWVRRTVDWNWRGAELAFREALRLRPDHAETLASLGVMVANLGHEQEAIALARRAAELDPLNAATQMDLLGIFYAFERYPEAERAGRRAIELSPGNPIVHSWVTLSLVGQRRFQEAEAEARLEPEPFARQGAQIMIEIGRGRTAEARALLQDFEAKAKAVGGAANSYAYLALLWGRAGDQGRGYEAIQKTRDIRDPSIAWARTAFFSTGLGTYPRWPEFLRSVGLADDQLK